MTIDQLNNILKENHIPSNVHIMSNSGWECSATEMEGIYYNKKENLIVFTQGIGDERYLWSYKWKALYRRRSIFLGNLQLDTVKDAGGLCAVDEYKKALRAAGDFENYYGFKPTKGAFDQITLNKPLFYIIHLHGKFVGYIGFTGNGDTLEPEIYIAKKYRNKGYGTRILSYFVNKGFKDGFLKEEKDKEPEVIKPKKYAATVKVDNFPSQKMMEKCGFKESREVGMEFMVFLGEGVNAGEEVKEYVLKEAETF